MNVVLINPRPTGRGMNEATIEPPVGLGYIAAMLEQEGYRCSIIDAQVLRLTDEEVLRRVTGDAGLVGITVNSFTVSAAANLARLLRERSAAKIVLGGPFPTAAPEPALRQISCDGVIRGEGEYAFAQVAANIAAGRLFFDGEISGACHLDQDGTLVSSPVKRIDDPDNLPFPAYHLLPPLRSYASRSRKKPVGPLITSRGCAFTCSFCSKDVFQRRVTFRSAENVLREVDHLVSRYGVRQLDILDDNFAQNRARLEEILDGLIERDYPLAVNMQTGIRTELLDEAVLKKMKRAGVFKIAFGVESADEGVLNLHRKKLDLGRVEETVRTAKRLGFVVYGFFIVGLPGETEDAFQKTLAFARRNNFDVANFCMALPFIGTDLFSMVKERGRFLVDTTVNIDSGFYDGTVYFEYDDETAMDILRRYRTAYREFYTLSRQLKLLRGVRSVSEALWLGKAAASVARGMLRGR